MDNLPNLVYRLSQNPHDYLLNFNVAKKYWELGHTPAAVSFFLRCAEYGESDPKAKNYVYASLLAISKCYENQTNRDYSVTNALLQALAFEDARPEAYWLLSVYYEHKQQWQESYTFAVLGLAWEWETEPLPIDIGYQWYSCMFQQAVAAYWIGRLDESRRLFIELTYRDLEPVYENAVKENLRKLGVEC